MNRIIILCVLFAITVFSSAQEKYSIKGTTGKELNGKKLYLYLIEDGKDIKNILWDSIEVKRRKFSFIGEQETPRIAIIKPTDTDKYYPLILENGNITMNIETNHRGGTSLNDTLDIAMYKVQPVMDSIMQMEHKVRQLIESIERDQFAEKIKNDKEFSTKILSYGDKISALKDPILQCINAHKNSLVGVYILLWTNKIVLDNDLKDMMKNASSVFAENIIVKKITEKKMISMKKIEEDIKKRISKKKIEHGKEIVQMDTKIKIDEHFLNAKVKDLSGKEMSLSDYVGKGKYVLIDFWASWCSPCRREMPNVKAAYEKYASKGFEVIGISTDNKQKDWKDAIQELGITWTQLQDVDAADIYGVYAIPTTYLIDSKGTIIAKNLRGNKLEETLAKIFQ